MAAQHGDAQSLAVLLMRHRAAMHAVATAVMGAGPDVEDVVQDASLVALTDVGRIRDPSLARAWLTGTTRNLARARLRRHEPIPADLAHMASVDDLERRIEEASLRDWVWEAIGGLSEPLHDVVVMRYFSMAARYDAIADALGVPVGTVRSRLHDARASLVSRLRELELQQRGLKNQQAKLLQAHYESAVPIDLLKSEQARIGQQLSVIEDRLHSLDADQAVVEQKLAQALDLLTDCGRAYAEAPDHVRRMFNQALFTAFLVDDGTVRAELVEPFRSLLSPDVVQAEAPETSRAGRGSKVLKSLTDAVDAALVTGGKHKPALYFFSAGLKQNHLVPRVGVEPTLNGF